MPRLKYGGNIWRLFTAEALLSFILWVPIWVVFLQGRGVTLTQIGVLEGFAWLLTAFLEVPTGAVADRWGRKASVAMGCALYALAMFLILAEALSPAFLLGYALWNSSMAFVSGADVALLYETLKADGREDQAAKQSGRYAAIGQGSQGVRDYLGRLVGGRPCSVRPDGDADLVAGAVGEDPAARRIRVVDGAAAGRERRLEPRLGVLPCD
jgi:MFS family permease